MKDPMMRWVINMLCYGSCAWLGICVARSGFDATLVVFMVAVVVVGALFPAATATLDDIELRRLRAALRTCQDELSMRHAPIIQDPDVPRLRLIRSDSTNNGDDHHGSQAG